MRTKIIATIGPNSESEQVFSKLAKIGFDIARINFSHCTYPEYRTRKKLAEKYSKKFKRKISVMQDLRGPRIRVGKLPEEGIRIHQGDDIVFSTNGPEKNVIHIDDPYLHLNIKKGDPIYLSNALMELVVTKVAGNKFTAKVIRGGHLFAYKAVNVPETKLTTSGFTDKDKKDVEFALNEGVDYIALSFVQSAKDVQALRAMVGNDIKIIAKIEMAMALKNIDEIIQASDGIMVARGDLGVEIPPEKVPFVQKNLIRHAAWYGKPSIVATQMLISMVNHPHPTRPEISDIANAVWDGADAVMLSDETASGKYPVESLEIMAKVVREADQSHLYQPNLF